MRKPGRPTRIVNKYAEDWQIGELRRLPRMRGAYILYDKRHRAFYCGIAGKGRSNAKSRISQHRRERVLGAKIRTFSVYDIDRGLMRQIETLMLHALGGKHVLRWNKHMGRFFKFARRITWKKTNRSEAAKKAWDTRRRNDIR